MVGVESLRTVDDEGAKRILADDALKFRNARFVEMLGDVHDRSRSERGRTWYARNRIAVARLAHSSTGKREAQGRLTADGREATAQVVTEAAASLRSIHR